MSKFLMSLKEAFTYERTELPAALKVVVQILFIAITTLVTMFFVPQLNNSFQKSERKLIFYSSIISELNGDTKEVLGALSILINDEISKEKEEEIYIDTRMKITQLHWRTVEFAIVFKGMPIEDEIRSYQEQLSLLEIAIKNHRKDRQAVPTRKAIEDFAYSSAKLLEALAKDADIVVSNQDETI